MGYKTPFKNNLIYRYKLSMSSGQNIGHFSRQSYDSQAYDDHLSESVGPLLYQTNPTQINNCGACLSVFGPRPSNGAASYGVSTTVGSNIAPAQYLTDVESILSNRNVISSRSKDGKVNDIDVSKFTLQHARICNDFMDPISTHLTDPPSNYRSLPINRFYDLPKNPQANIFYNWAVNTKLDAIDNYRQRIPILMKCDSSLPPQHN